jgi:hypothetical protein
VKEINKTKIRKRSAGIDRNRRIMMETKEKEIICPEKLETVSGG